MAPESCLRRLRAAVSPCPVSAPCHCEAAGICPLCGSAAMQAAEWASVEPEVEEPLLLARLSRQEHVHAAADLLTCCPSAEACWRVWVGLLHLLCLLALAFITSELAAVSSLLSRPPATRCTGEAADSPATAPAEPTVRVSMASSPAAAANARSSVSSPAYAPLPDCATVGLPRSESVAHAARDFRGFSPAHCEIVVSDQPAPAEASRAERWPVMDLVIPVVAKDAVLLQQLLHSLELLFPDYRRVKLLVEQRDLYVLLGALPVGRGRYSVVVMDNPLRQLEAETGSDYGYLLHQLYKMYCEQLSDADFISILDSDMILYERARPRHFFRLEAGQLKPLSMMRPWADMTRGCVQGQPCEGSIWRAGMDFAMNGRDPAPGETSATYNFSSHSFMARHPFTYPRELFPSLRLHLESLHRKPLVNFFEHFLTGLQFELDGRSDKFSEFNVLGQFAWQSRFHSSMHWLEVKDGAVQAAGDELPNVLLHLSRYRNPCMANPKVTYDYLMTAVMEQHKRFCLHVHPAHVLCAFSPPATLRSEYDRLDREANQQRARERRAALKAKEEAEGAARSSHTAPTLTGSAEVGGVTK